MCSDEAEGESRDDMYELREETINHNIGIGGQIASRETTTLHIYPQSQSRCGLMYKTLLFHNKNLYKFLDFNAKIF